MRRGPLIDVHVHMWSREISSYMEIHVNSTGDLIIIPSFPIKWSGHLYLCIRLDLNFELGQLRCRACLSLEHCVLSLHVSVTAGAESMAFLRVVSTYAVLYAELK